MENRDHYHPYYSGVEQQQQETGQENVTTQGRSDTQQQALDMLGISPSTFSTNVAFQVPRFLQDSFDPALLQYSTSIYPPQTSGYTSNDANNRLHASSSGNVQTSMDMGAYPQSASSAYFNAPFLQHSSQVDGSHFPNPSSVEQSSGNFNEMERAVAVPASAPSASALATSNLLPPGVPIYSASGFDMLDILARVATRPNPKVQLGPVDMTCSFLVVDITRDDSPIIYVSSSFSVLTGYEQSEILGRNCRFLQAPPSAGPLRKGAPREHTDPEGVTKLAKAVSQNKECQVSLMNYRKNGEAFINCLTVIPIIPPNNEPIRYQVGFQVDLAEQPHAILEAVRAGTYVVNYSTAPIPPYPGNNTATGAGGPNNSARFAPKSVSKDMLDVVQKIEAGNQSGNETQDKSKVGQVLLENASDPIFVLSLKGTFLYVSPPIAHVLDQDASYFLGKTVVDICHPSDVPLLMRHVKESAPQVPAQATVEASGQSRTVTNTGEQTKKEVHLLFRARHQAGHYVWLDCFGRLHSESSRGRKALVLHVSQRPVPRVSWQAISASSSLTNGGMCKNDCWVRIARDTRALVISASRSAESVLGKAREDLIGQSLLDFIVDDADGNAKRSVQDGIRNAHNAASSGEDVHTVQVYFQTSVKRSAKDHNVSSSGNHTMADVDPSRSKDAASTGSGDGSPFRTVDVIATVEISFFSPRSPKETKGIDAEEDIDMEEGTEGKNHLYSMSCRLRVLSMSRKGSRTDTMTMQADFNDFDRLSQFRFPPQPLAESSQAASIQPTNCIMPIPATATGDVNAIDDDEGPVSSTAPIALDASSAADPLGGASGQATAVAANSSMGNVVPSSSWQYQLQRLRMRNQKLCMEVDVLEKKRRETRREKNRSRTLPGHNQNRSLMVVGQGREIQGQAAAALTHQRIPSLTTPGPLARKRTWDEASAWPWME